MTGPSDTPARPLRLGRRIEAVDLHACGEPGRVIVGGVLDVPGATMFDKMTWLRANGDGLRLRMLREPRGYPAANCNLILPPTHPDAQAGYVIMEQVEYPGMSGTNTICVVTALLETGMIEMVEPVTELIDLIKTQRAFELNSQVVQAGDQILQMIANLRRA